MGRRYAKRLVEVGHREKGLSRGGSARKVVGHADEKKT